MSVAEVSLAWGATSHRGLQRSHNEDRYLVSNVIFFVADGMGGHEAGEVASGLAIEALAPLAGQPQITPEQIHAQLACAEDRIRAISTEPGRGAGTTLTGVVVTERDSQPYWLVVNIGDSRTYRFSRGLLEQISVDHSEVQEMLDAGLLTEAEAAAYPRRNVVTRALGSWRALEPDFWYVPISSGDRMILCSDGLTAELTPEEIARILADVNNPQDAADFLVHKAMSSGGRDNITVVVVDATGVSLDAGGSSAASRGGATGADEADWPQP